MALSQRDLFLVSEATDTDLVPADVTSVPVQIAEKLGSVLKERLVLRWAADTLQRRKERRRSEQQRTASASCRSPASSSKVGIESRFYRQCRVPQTARGVVSGNLNAQARYQQVEIGGTSRSELRSKRSVQPNSGGSTAFSSQEAGVQSAPRPKESETEKR